MGGDATKRANEGCIRRKIWQRKQPPLLQIWQTTLDPHTLTLAGIFVMYKDGYVGWDAEFSPSVAELIRTDSRAQRVATQRIFARVPIECLRDVICITIVWSTDEVGPQPKRWRIAAQNSRNRRFPDKHGDVHCTICCGELADVKLHCGQFICATCVGKCDICPFCRGKCLGK